MSNNNTIEFLDSLQRFGWQLSLNNITTLLKEMGNPQNKFKSIHIAGSNGKGSTAAILESILRRSGYKTGLYTSPHLIAINERIKIDGHNISTQKLIYYLRCLEKRILSIGCTYFETLTAIAFQYFADAGVDIAIIEVGLGGRYDATNAIIPLLSIITEISLEHTEYLGTGKIKIAREKGGIIKSGVPCLSQSDCEDVNTALAEIASLQKSKLYRLNEICLIRKKFLTEDYSHLDLDLFGEEFNNLKLNLSGEYQLKNAATAVSASFLMNASGFFRIDKQHIRQGLKVVRWPGRLEKLQEHPKLIVDVAHNAAALQNLMDNVKMLYRFERLLLVIGMLKDKNYFEISKIISSAADYIFVVTPDEPTRALDSAIFANEVAKHSSNYKNCSNLKAGYRTALSFSTPRDLICITGSHYIVGEFLNFYKKA